MSLRVRRSPLGWPLGLCAGAALALTSVDASAAMMGSLTTSVGLMTALVAMLVVKASTSGLVSGNHLLSAGGAVLGVVAGAALVRRARKGAWAPRLAMSPSGNVANPQRLTAPGGHSPWRERPAVLPAGIDRAEFLASARRHFVDLQAAWDAGDIGTLRALTSPNMLEELRCQLPERGLGPNRTDVLTLHAELLAFEEHGAAYLASVEFSGMIRERADEGAVPFRELWMLARSKDGASGWRLARQQALL